VNRLDIFVQVRAELSGESPAALRAGFTAHLQKTGRKLYEKFVEELDDAEATSMYQGLRQSFGALKSYIGDSPERYEEILSVLGVTKEAEARERAMSASYALAEHVRTRGAYRKVRITREYLQNTGSFWWRHSFEHVNEDDLVAAYREMHKYIESVRAAPGMHPSGLTNQEWAEDVGLMLQVETGQSLFLLSARWAHYAFPIVQYGGHRYAAALMSTGIPQDIEIKPPWKTFLIELPTNMLHTRGAVVLQPSEVGQDEFLAYVMVSQHAVTKDGVPIPDSWSFDAYTSEGTSLHRWRASPEELRSGELSHLDHMFPDAFSNELTSRDDRTLFLLSRLVVNTCLAMSNPENVRSVGRHPKNDPVGPPRGTKDPVCRVFRVGKPITLDCRPALEEYLSGAKRGPLTVQFLVRGHWRWQACGTRMTERRMTWIEPYWKGPEDAGIAVRPHTVGFG
jgi:hypothetical protein